MADLPIIFSAPMVRALLDGRKTMTRRLVWRPHGPMRSFSPPPLNPSPWRRVQPGDRLWVREAWRTDARCNGERPVSIGAVEYEASDRLFPEMPLGKLRPSIHMPRWASRITLTVTAVRVERLQKISEGDAIDEGIRQRPDGDWGDEGRPGAETAAGAFALLWDRLHGPGAWDANPAVAVISFTVENRNIDDGR